MTTNIVDVIACLHLYAGDGFLTDDEEGSTTRGKQGLGEFQLIAHRLLAAERGTRRDAVFSSRLKGGWRGRSWCGGVNIGDAGNVGFRGEAMAG